MSFSNEPVDQDSIPKYEEVSLTPLPESAMWVVILSQTMVLVIVLVIAVVGRILNIPLFVEFLSYWIIAVLIITAVLMFWSWFSFRYKGFALRDHDVIYQRGIIWRKVTVLPFNRVQHVETTQGILQRRFNLMTLNLFTAGGLRADLAIPGMDKEVTEGIKTMLLNRIQQEQHLDA